MTSPDAACHELLLRMAGRLPDELLWRMRDWLADGGRDALAATLPRELLRHRVGLTDHERDLLETAVVEWGAAHQLLDAVLPALDPDEVTVTFRADPGAADLDTAALSVLAVVRGHPGCVELRQGSRRSAGAPEQRVVLVLGAERPWALTGTLQRVLRAHGDRTPCVEVLPPHGEPPAYHRAAIIGSAPLWRSAAALAGA
ncbi:hypothetical protein BJF78_10295 [Pseudonocardia sp. CNS-139]|nr:hypothetical protein BJF78_10295 [Pseudonocardia sp. CNS-139]